MLNSKILFVVTLLVLLFAYWYNPLSKKLGPVIQTKYGKVQGVQSISRSGKDYYEFLGIPFASPPVGEKRFEPPEPPASWEGIKQADSYGNKCIQIELIGQELSGDEDCLYLNVFTPKKKLANNKGYPVMVFIHGGAFGRGSACAYGAKHLLDEDVVLVTINYRLAALGFMNTGDGVVRGNMGLKDQVKALEWTKENIQAFGGDPNKVTIFGESAGAASVELLILSPLTEGLFHKAISQSGSALSSWAISKNPKKKAQRYAAKFNCPTEDSKEMVACLKKIDAATFVKEHIENSLPLRDPIKLFTPSIEYIKDSSAFLTDEPKKILESGKFQKVPLISGVNSDDGLLASAVVVANKTELEDADSKWTEWVSRLLALPEDEKIALKLRKFYFGDKKSIGSKDYLKNFTNMYSDRMFFRDMHNHAKLYAKHAPIRLYYYTYKGDFSLAPILASTQGPLPIIKLNVVWDMFVRWFNSYFFNIVSPHMGACHADELALLLNIQELKFGIYPGDRDYPLSVDMVKLWTSFASQENSEVLKFKDATWNTVKVNDSPLKYLKIDADAAIIDEPFTDRIKFWESLNIKQW